LSCEILAEVIELTEQDLTMDLSDAVAAVTFDDLSIEQARVDTPGAAAFIGGLHPSPEMGRERIKVERQAIAGENGQTVLGQALGDVMDQLMGERLGAWAEGEGGDQLGAGVARDPEPGGFGGGVELQAKFIKLDMGQM
jgi:hypothetical protein